MLVKLLRKFEEVSWRFKKIASVFFLFFLVESVCICITSLALLTFRRSLAKWLYNIMIKSDDEAHSLMQSLNDVYMASLGILNRKSHVL